MKPDEDYEDIEENAPAGNARVMSWLVLAVAVGGFSALAYYAYHSGSRARSDDGMVVIEADSAPIKEAPVDPEGEQFANKDKTIYDVIGQHGSAAEGEKLMPEPERPVAAANTEDEDSIAAAMEPVATPNPAPAAKPVEAAPAVAATKPVETAPGATTYVAPEVAAADNPPAKPEEKSFSSPQMINEKTVTGKAETNPAPKKEAKAAPAKSVSKPAVEASAATPSARGGAYKLQLGAFKSQGEAEAAWKKLSGKYASVLKGSPTIVKADLPNGTFYRLRAGSFADSAAAKATCAQMAGQPCMPVK